jgi:protein gp37
MLQDLTSAKPGRLSDVQTIVAGYEKLQADIDAAARATQIAAQRAAEDAEQRIATLRASCPLSQWQDLNAAERAILLAPGNSRGGTFNQQEGAAIEWAQWSWNPVTGCKHACPYCYAREFALSERGAKVYPNGWEPTLCSSRLGAPGRTKVPENAEKDTRYRNVFTCSMADLFGRWVPAEWIEAVLSSVRSAPQWNFLFLTKFPQRLAEIEAPDNAWLGTTVDVQARVANTEKAFAKVGGKVKWLSVEPMIEPLRFERLDLFDWVVIGGASPTKADGESPMTPAWQPPYRWIDSLVRQCDDAKVPIYMKSNLGIANRVLELPFLAPIAADPQQAPAPFIYLGKT